MSKRCGRSEQKQGHCGAKAGDDPSRTAGRGMAADPQTSQPYCCRRPVREEELSLPARVRKQMVSTVSSSIVNGAVGTSTAKGLWRAVERHSQRPGVRANYP
jgi:hypothetical protein